ncbi:hypothetical protein ACFSSA_02255 [Luteolibacter algae]|uniref:SLA1 homology domain-containing protein n=1 Tax=Luteolibacter algae TaxID=454151 RepID=A0ABW5D7B4_9BACT
MMKTRSLLLLLATASHLAAHHIDRVWTDERGRSTKAILLKVENNCAILKLPDGREAPFPLEKLSKVDQAFIEKFGLDGHDEDPEESEQREAPNFDSPWPERVTFEGDPEINVVEEDADAKTFIYESANYRYNCDVRLSKTVVKGFAVMFEATHQYVRELPLAVSGGKKKDGKYQIYLFETAEDYLEAGGPPNSAGVFIGGKNIILVPLTSLGVQKVGSGYMLDRDKSSKTLPHEMVHQLTPNQYFNIGARGWFSEGIAEYVALTPYRSGSFNVRSNFKPILEYATGYGEKGRGGRALGDEIEIGSLKTFMLQDYSTFLDDAQINYGCSLLLANYFFHMDRDGDGARIKKFLQALNAGKEGEEALEVLLDGQTFEELEEEIGKAYSRKGVDFIFSK